MSGAKRLMEKMETKRWKAREITLKAGVLTTCHDHDDEVFRSEIDVADAYELGKERFSKDSLGKIFSSREEMTDYIKEVTDEANTECAMCEEFRANCRED